jgi:GNAT superfamily N-acetyltransferase
MNVQIINKSKHATPIYETDGSAGMDLRANISESILLKPLERTIVKTGLFIALPAGFEAQGKGIGKKLMAWLENKAKQKSYEIIWLDAMNEQQQSFQFYKKLGYKYHSHIFLPFDLLHEAVRKMNQLYKVI